MSDTNVHRVVGNLLVGTSHFFVDTTTNQIGVNTSTPSAALDVASGDLKVGSGITLASGGTITAANFSGNGSGLTQVNSDQGSWVNGASSNIHLAVSTDKVGIGTVEPSNLLHVYKANNDETSGILIEKASDSIPTCAALFFGVASTTETNNRGIPKAAIFYERNLVNGRGDIKFCNDAANDANPVTTEAVDTRMIIKNSGEVGVGTVSPQTLLHVAGNGQTSTGGIIRAQLDDPGGGPYESNAFTMKMGSYSHSIRMDLNTLRLNAYGDAGRYGAMQFVVGDGTGSGNGQVTAMTIGTGGQVGIGTSSPNYKLHVVDSESYSVVGRIESKNPTTSGTPSSAYVDVVDGGGHGGYIQGYHDPFVTHGLRLGTWTGGGRDSAKMYILSNGRVGVGTSGPGAILDVEGSDAASPIKKSASTASTGTYNFVLNGPRPGTTGGGATHFINGSTRGEDGGASVYTIRNDSGQLRLGHGSYTTVFEGNHLRMNQGDNSFFHFGPNGTWSGELYVGATSSRSTTAAKAQVISTDGNLHLDSGTGKALYLNHHTNTAIYRKGPQYWHGRPMVMVGKNNGRVYTGSYVIFDVVGYNDGSMYNSSNGRFTAPWNGFYMFTTTLLGGEREVNSNTRWYLNGGSVGWGAAHYNLGSGFNFNYSNARNGLSSQMIYYMVAGQYMQMYIVGGSIYGASYIHSTTTCVYLGGSY